MVLAGQMLTDNRNLQGTLNTDPKEEYLNMFHQHMGVAARTLKDNSYPLDMVELP